MRLELDVHQVRACVKLWRETVAVRPYAANEATLVARADLLRRASASVGAWLDLLRMCRSEDLELNQLAVELEAFRAWADEGSHALNVISAVERAQGHAIPARLDHSRTRAS